MITTIKPNWPVTQKIKAFTTTRYGGVSLPPYENFNLATHVGDDLHNVLCNRQRLRDTLLLPSEPVWLSQTHSTQVVKLPLSGNEVPQADAVYTQQRQQICAVMTADCLPVLFYSIKGGEVAAAHAGWRGLCNGILENTLACFQAAPQDIIAWLGPAIGPKAFEVGAEVRQQFILRIPEAEQAFRAKQEGKYLADIYLLARQRLQRAGIHQIYGGNYCTMNNQSLFFSYRRQKQTGRMVSLIWLE